LPFASREDSTTLGVVWGRAELAEENVVRRVLACLVVLPIVAAAGRAAADDREVRAGETLSEIAARHGVTIEALAFANNIADANVVIAGTVLSIPGRSETYVVNEGETLERVASRVGSSVGELAQQNGIADPNFLLAGQRLVVPVSERAGLFSAASEGVTVPAFPGPVPPSAAKGDIEAALGRWASRNEVDPSLAKGLAWHESGWHQDVVSSTGAIGVMQLEPSASAHVSADLIGLPGLDPMVMEDNVRMGVRYLRQLLADFEGDERLALAGYYQGERAVRQIGVYSESERYVANVQANRALFASR
jgi:LysM repeat protein